MARHIITLKVHGEQPLTRSERYDEDLHIAIADFVHENHFLPLEQPHTEFNAVLSKEDQRVLLTMHAALMPATAFLVTISTKPLRSLMRDYFMMVESYQQAIRNHDTRKIEAVDMGRRGMHNEGAEMLMDMLADTIDMDFCTARRLFTLIATLHMK
jgi:uncharacterized protein (UPF0262 family)